MNAAASDATATGDRAPVSSPVDQLARFSLAGKVAIVTGGSRGLGLRIVEAYCAAGARICLLARDAQRLADVAADLGTAGAEVATVVGSAADPAAIEAVVAHCLDRFGRLDVVVNNAGVDVATPLLEPDWPAVEAMWQLHYFGPWRMIETAHRAWMADHGGSIVNISSTAAMRARPVMAAYGMSKAALVDLTKRLAADLGLKVRVNCIAPGVVETEMLRGLWDSQGGDPLRAGGEGSWPLRRMGEPDDVASAALYLASDASAWVTGHTLMVDGGMSTQ